VTAAERASEGQKKPVEGCIGRAEEASGGLFQTEFRSPTPLKSTDRQCGHRANSIPYSTSIRLGINEQQQPKQRADRQ